MYTIFGIDSVEIYHLNDPEEEVLLKLVLMNIV
jgi:hypothetical protein